MIKNPHPPGKTMMDLTPLPLRVSEMSIERLRNLRLVEGVTIQEHVRRAIDDYLDRKERLVQDLRATNQQTLPTDQTPMEAPAAHTSPSADAAAGSHPYKRVKVR